MAGKAMLLIAAMAVVCSTPALADISCAAGSVCTVSLTSSNIVQLQGIVATVTIDNTGTNTVLTFQVTSNPLVNTPIGIDQVGWNYGSNPPDGYVSTSSQNFSGLQAVNVSNANGSCSSMDGFGQFCIQGQSPANTGGFGNAVSFTLAGQVFSFPGNGSGNEFALHVRYSGSCSGFVGGLLGTASNTIDVNCIPATPPPPAVPEPASLYLLGGGLLVFRARLRQLFQRQGDTL